MKDVRGQTDASLDDRRAAPSIVDDLSRLPDANARNSIRPAEKYSVTSGPWFHVEELYAESPREAARFAVRGGSDLRSRDEFEDSLDEQFEPQDVVHVTLENGPTFKFRTSDIIDDLNAENLKDIDEYEMEP